jgi:outer membrane immunogenic protein
MISARDAAIFAAGAAAAVVGALVFTSTQAKADPWSGFYIGGAGSYGATTLEDTLGADTVGAAAIVGYDQRIHRWVPGVFAEYGWKTLNWAPGFGGGVDVDITSWTAGGRLGLLITDTSMLFVTAGYTVGDASFNDDDESIELSGYVVGAGAELDLSHGFAIRPEYRLTQYNEVEDESIDASVHEARLAIVYKFGGPEIADRVPLK